MNEVLIIKSIALVVWIIALIIKIIKHNKLNANSPFYKEPVFLLYIGFISFFLGTLCSYLFDNIYTVIISILLTGTSIIFNTMYLVSFRKAKNNMRNANE